mgnify:FL=1
MGGLTLDQASKLVDLVFARSHEMKLVPPTVAVLDSGGHLKAFKRSDGAGIVLPELAIGKAWGALALGCDTRKISQAPAHLIAPLVVIGHGKVVPTPGGVLLRNTDGEIIGAIGVTGDEADNDEVVGLYAANALGLRGGSDEG